jgi:outer membrane immunogenic protein
MKKIVLTGAALVAFSVAPAIAADLAAVPYYTKAPVVPALYNWAGFYAGLNAGGASSHNCWNLTGANILGVFGPVVPAVAEGCHNATGALAGGQFGYRWQASNWVFGVEAQGDWANLKGSSPSVLVLPGSTVTNQTKIDALGLFTGQFGYAWNSVLWYVKGGAALTHDRYDGIATATGIAFGQATETRWGGAVGTGLEWQFAPGWSVGVEYDHLFMGNRGGISFTSLAPPVGIVTRTEGIKQDVDMGTVRINYTFGASVARY